MKAPALHAARVSHPNPAETAFAGLFGLLLGVGLLKFGNPVILDALVGTPRGIDEWRAFAWPVRVGYWGLGVTVAAGILAMRKHWSVPAPRWVLGSLGAWLGWQFIAAPGSIDPGATRLILPHFVACTACFLLGNIILSRVSEPRVFWLCLVGGFGGVLGMSFDQRFGGLDETRKMILESANAAQLPPEYLARIQSRRVFGTLVYPNALAGAVLLCLPWASVLAWRIGERWGRFGSQLLAGTLLTSGGAVLIWSGSKAGWLIGMAMILFLIFHSPLSRSFKVGLAAILLAAGLTGFAVAYSEKLSRGATSVAARLDYWSAAWKGFAAHPLMGNGPGGFKTVYSSVKRPESEMAQLAHNDYLQQATDSGLPGFLAYGGVVFGSLLFLYRQRNRIPDPFLRCVWLGLAGWFIQGGLEFGLYVPATSWCAFSLLGWLLAQKPSADAR